MSNVSFFWCQGREDGEKERRQEYGGGEGGRMRERGRENEGEREGE